MPKSLQEELDKDFDIIFNSIMASGRNKED